MEIFGLKTVFFLKLEKCEYFGTLGINMNMGHELKIKRRKFGIWLHTKSLRTMWRSTVLHTLKVTFVCCEWNVLKLNSNGQHSEGLIMLSYVCVASILVTLRKSNYRRWQWGRSKIIISIAARRNLNHTNLRKSKWQQWNHIFLISCSV